MSHWKVEHHLVLKLDINYFVMFIKKRLYYTGYIYLKINEWIKINYNTKHKLKYSIF